MQDSKTLPNLVSQMELPIERSHERDRNFHKGGRSFYFFDFDDNVAFLSTPIILFHKETGQALSVSSRQYAQELNSIGIKGPFKDYEINWEDKTGSFRNFRDLHIDELQKLGLKTQVFLQDVANALGMPDFNWKGPSWSCFYHATFNQRPLSIITARGHQPDTIKSGVDLFVRAGHLTQTPNFLSVFPVSHAETRVMLGDAELKKSVPQLKQAAIRASVKQAIDLYGMNPHHRFGMSDDDPNNLQLIVEEMTRLKTDFPEMSFFVIETKDGEFVKHEITHSGAASQHLEQEQVALF